MRGVARQGGAVAAGRNSAGSGSDPGMPPDQAARLQQAIEPTVVAGRLRCSDLEVGDGCRAIERAQGETVEDVPGHAATAVRVSALRKPPIPDR